MKERRRMMMGGDSKFFVFKEGEGFMNGFNAKDSSAVITDDFISLNNTRGARINFSATSDSFNDFSVAYFECEVISGDSSYVGYNYYSGGNVPVSGKYKEVTKKSREIYTVPIDHDETNEFGIFNAKSGYGSYAYTKCYNIWLE